MPAVSTATRSVRSARIATFGHSIGAFLFYNPMGAAFNRKLRHIMSHRVGTVGDGLPNGIDLYSGAIGGSYVSQANRDAYEVLVDEIGDPIPLPTAWVDDTSGTPMSSTALTALTSVYSVRTDKITAFYGCTGYGDARTMKGTGDLTPADAITKFRTALNYYIGQLQTSAAQGGTLPPVGLIQIGRHSTASNDLSLDRARQVLLARINATATWFKMCEQYDVPLGDSAHPGDEGQIIIAYRCAEMFANFVYGVASYVDETGVIIVITPGPTFTSVTKQNRSVVRVVIDGGIEDITYPDTPPPWIKFGATTTDWTQVFDPITNPIPVVDGKSWKLVSKVGHVYTFDITLTSTIASNMRMFAPFDDCPDLNSSNLILGKTGLKKPVQTWLQ